MNIHRQAATHRASHRKGAIAAGVLFLITHVTSIGSFALYDPILSNASNITGSGSDVQVLAGALLEVILALAVVGTSVALYPAVKRYNEGIALGYVGLRTLEAGVIAVGVLPLLVLVTLRQLAVTAGADPTTLNSIGPALVSFHDWTLILGPGLICATNTVLMAYLMFTSHLVPRFIPVLGLIGGPAIFAVSVARLFGISDPTWMLITVIPIFAWEVTLAFRLITKGYRSSATTPETTKSTATELLSAA